ncbi:MAG: hypothetical protein GY748_05685 [Planctomycetaceae bacterium]|nr:hypothetical protein [Planctomycetaceae bacterium]
MSFFDETNFDNQEPDDWLAALALDFDIALAKGLEAQPEKLNAKQATHNKKI